MPPSVETSIEWTLDSWNMDQHRPDLKIIKDVLTSTSDAQE